MCFLRTIMYVELTKKKSSQLSVGYAYQICERFHQLKMLVDFHEFFNMSKSYFVVAVA